ncbi:MAG: hypothetical protein KMY54_06455, partial [Erysipelothrix sp.]|nr:hypothetical protein [Erysipelothrix sp.]
MAAISADNDCSADMAAMFGASLAICVSDIPFNGPIAGVIVGRINGELIINPTVAELEVSDINLTVAGTKKAINMVEAGAKEVSEEDMLDAMLFGHEFIKRLCEFQEEIVAKVGKPKREIALYGVDAQLNQQLRGLCQSRLEDAVRIKEKLVRYGAIEDIEAEMVTYYEGLDYASDKVKDKTIKQVKQICHDIVSDEIRRLISVEKIRPDGRGIDELRALNSQIDLLARVHGSALFTRGETQVMSICTLGAMGDTQIIDDMTDIESKRFMHHYNFPQFSVGETGPIRGPGRREIGHGALGERALAFVLPTEEEFPYAIRLIGTPAAINAIVPAQIDACDDEPLDSNVSSTKRMAYGNSSSVGNT